VRKKKGKNAKKSPCGGKEEDFFGEISLLPFFSSPVPAGKGEGKGPTLQNHHPLNASRRKKKREKWEPDMLTSLLHPNRSRSRWFGKKKKKKKKIPSQTSPPSSSNIHLLRGRRRGKGRDIGTTHPLAICTPVAEEIRETSFTKRRY